MDKKTNLSEEFGVSSNFASREFGAYIGKLEPKTDLSPEINRSTGSDSSEFGAANTDKEFAFLSGEPDPPRKTSRREQHSRSLMLQMAAVGLSAVLVTNSFGMDILGDDKLFPSDSASEYIAVREVVDESRYDEETNLETIPYVIYSSDRAEVNPGPYEDTVHYDEVSNTLYLDGCRLDQLHICEIEEDVTIFVENTSYVGLLISYGSSITISGNPGTSLIVNNHTRESWWYGIILYGEGGDVALSISPDVTVNVRGNEGVIAVDNTTADPGIRFDESLTDLSGIVKSGAFPFGIGGFVEGGETDWTIVDASGAMAEHVAFAPIGTEPPGWYYGFWEQEDFGTLPDIGDSQAWENMEQYGEFGELSPTVLAGDWTVCASSSEIDGVTTADENPSGSMSFTEDGQFVGMLDRAVFGTWRISTLEVWSDGTTNVEYELLSYDAGTSIDMCTVRDGSLHISISADGITRSFMLEQVK